MADFPDPAVLKEIMGLLSIPESRLEADLISAVNRQYQRIKDASEPKSLFSVFEADVRDSHIIFDGAFSIIGKDLAYTCSGPICACNAEPSRCVGASASGRAVSD